jgi:hypothetical protein
MRFLISLCALLLIANLAVLLWPDQSRGAAHIYSEKSEVNAHFVRLNKEIEEEYLDAKAQNLTVSDIEFAAADSNSANGCYRLGPFMHRSNYELAQAVLFNANVKYQKSTRSSKQSNVYRVYLGPFTTLAEANDMRVELTRKKVLDHFVRKESERTYIVSLGIYTTNEFAGNAVQLFKDKLDSVKLKQETVVLPNSFWLHFTLERADHIRGQLMQMDWGEQSAKLGKFRCLEA